LVPNNLVIALAKLQTGDRRSGAILFRRFLSNITNSGRCAAPKQNSNVSAFISVGMAKKNTTSRKSKSKARKNVLERINLHAAGIDIGANFHFVAIGEDCTEEPVVLGARDRPASVRENCLPVIASAGTKADTPPSLPLPIQPRKLKALPLSDCSVPHAPVPTK
jgi:hypothetical protein